MDQGALHDFLHQEAAKTTQQIQKSGKEMGKSNDNLATEDEALKTIEELAIDMVDACVRDFRGMTENYGEITNWLFRLEYPYWKWYHYNIKSPEWRTHPLVRDEKGFGGRVLLAGMFSKYLDDLESYSTKREAYKQQLRERGVDADVVNDKLPVKMVPHTPLLKSLEKFAIHFYRSSVVGLVKDLHNHTILGPQSEQWHPEEYDKAMIQHYGNQFKPHDSTLRQPVQAYHLLNSPRP